MMICLDPGHGGADPGVVVDGIREADIVLGIALELGQVLAWQGWTVHATREIDGDLSLDRRAAFVNDLDPDLCVSIHANAHDSQATGSEAWLRRQPGPAVEARVARLLVAWSARALGTRQRGVKHAGFKVLRLTHPIPAVLLEVGFLTGPGKATRLADRLKQAKIASYLAHGLLEAERSNAWST